MNKEFENKDIKTLKSKFDSIYSNGGFGYNKEIESELLFSVINDKEGSTLLDVGCGDGFWSNILSEKYKVTGIDISKKGIENAKLLNPDLLFIEDDFLLHKFKEKFDIVFMRSPSFLNFKTESNLFDLGIRKAVKVCKNSLWYIKWSVEPFDRYLENSYIHNPEKVKEVFQKHGKTEIIIKGNYFFINLKPYKS